MRTIFLSLLPLAALLLHGCGTCTESGARSCGDGEILTCVDTPDGSTFELKTACEGPNPTCVEDPASYPTQAACVLKEGQELCSGCLDGRYQLGCAVVGTKPVTIAYDCRLSYPDPVAPGICDPQYGGCRQCNPGSENCDGSCTPGEERCFNGQLARCEDDGKTWSMTACAGYNSSCFEDPSVSPRQAACVYQSYTGACAPYCLDGYTTVTCEKLGTIDVAYAFDCREIAADNACSSATGACVR